MTITEADPEQIREEVSASVGSMNEWDFRAKRHSVWASMLRRTLPAMGLLTVVALLAMWGAVDAASYVAVAIAGAYASASFQAATKKKTS